MNLFPVVPMALQLITKLEEVPYLQKVEGSKSYKCKLLKKKKKKLPEA